MARARSLQQVRAPHRLLSRCVAGCVALALAGGCVPEAERVMAARSRYEATVNGWVVEQTPRPSEPAGAVEQRVLLDVLVRYQPGDSGEPLPGVTLDVSHTGPDRQEKGRRQVWVDTSKIAPGPGSQVTLTLDGLDVRPGDRFRVEVRKPIPAGERGDYREFPDAS